MTCPLDGIALAEHARCPRCGLLLGQAHLAGPSIGGFCRDCATRPDTGAEWAEHSVCVVTEPTHIGPGVCRQKGGTYRAFVSAGTGRGRRRVVIGDYADSDVALRVATAARAARDAGADDRAIVEAGRAAE